MGDKAARAAVLCHALGEDMTSRCGDCEEGPFDGCVVQRNLSHNVCSSCIFAVRGQSCEWRTRHDLDSDEEKGYVPHYARGACRTSARHENRTGRSSKRRAGKGGGSCEASPPTKRHKSSAAAAAKPAGNGEATPTKSAAGTTDEEPYWRLVTQSDLDFATQSLERVKYFSVPGYSQDTIRHVWHSLRGERVSTTYSDGSDWVSLIGAVNTARDKNTIFSALTTIAFHRWHREQTELECRNIEEKELGFC